MSFISINKLSSLQNEKHIKNRYKLLNSNERQILKIASLIGYTFTYQELIAILELLEYSKYNRGLKESLYKLIHSNFIYYKNDMIYINEYNSNNNIYVFMNDNIHKYIYNLINIKTRVHIHNTIAEYLEQSLTVNAYNYKQRILYHYINSNNIMKQLEYLEYGAVDTENKLNFLDMYNYYNKVLMITLGDYIYII